MCPWGSYNQVVAELIHQVRDGGRERAGDLIEAFLGKQTGASRYWPDDRELRAELVDLPAFRRLQKGRLRMVFEAIEDHLRGWKGGSTGFGGERATRGKWVIEHVMPRKWLTHWPIDGGVDAGLERDQRVHRLGNLTLLTRRLNSKVSNAGWLGEGGKRSALEAHDVLLLNRDLLRSAGEAWTDAAIERRTELLIEQILEIWPVPAGHVSGFSHQSPRRRRRVQLSDLISAGLLEPGTVLHPRRKKFRGRIGILLGDGRVEIDGVAYGSPSDAARSIRGGAANGWWFFLVDPATKRSLMDVRSEYLEALDADDVDDDGDDDGDERDNG